MVIEIFSTGGTFEKIYGTGAGITNFTFPVHSSVEEMIYRFGLTDVTVTYQQEAAKDSLNMIDLDRALIADWCATRRRSVVIHGTDTMIETARVIARRCSGNLVILTGSSQPACMRNSDAEFNLGSAIIAAQMPVSGVYIAMNGRLFKWDTCKKNPVTGYFEPL